MATNPEELAPGADNETENLDPNAQPENLEGGEGEDQELPSVEQLARDIGWVPKDDYQGPAEQWKPADQFIRDGRDIQRETARELKALRSTVETIGKTSASVVEQEVNRRVDELAVKYNKAVEDGDPNAAYRYANEIGSLTAPRENARPSPSPEAQGFAERNKTWFKTSPTAPGDPLATARAVEICNTLAGQGYDTETQLKSAEAAIKREFPHLFGQGMNGTKPQASVASPGARGPQGNGGRAKGFADMPREAQTIANDMVARGVIPNRESYVKNYFANAERKA